MERAAQWADVDVVSTDEFFKSFPHGASMELPS